MRLRRCGGRPGGARPGDRVVVVVVVVVVGSSKTIHRNFGRRLQDALLRDGGAPAWPQPLAACGENHVLCLMATALRRTACITIIIYQRDCNLR